MNYKKIKKLKLGDKYTNGVTTVLVTTYYQKALLIDINTGEAKYYSEHDLSALRDKMNSDLENDWEKVTYENIS